jgi:hypothetical protein
VIFVAAIAFGPLGPARHQSFDDGVVRARVIYRIAHDRDHDTGPAAASPSIAAGFLTLTVAGKTRTIDLASLFPIHETRIDFAEPILPNQGCGVGETLSRRDDYLAVQAIVAEKGCAAIAAFVDIRTGRPIEEVVLDHATTYRFDAKPGHFRGTRFVVREIERISLDAGSLDATGRPIRTWPFAIVHAADQRGAMHVFVFDTVPDVPNIPKSAMMDLPRIGSHVTVGDLVATSDPFGVVRFFAGERLIRLDDADETRFASRLASPSPVEERARRRQGWFLAADSDANSGHFDEAVSDFTTMLSYEDDRQLYAEESAFLAACEQMQARVRAGSMSEAAASATFQFRLSDEIGGSSRHPSLILRAERSR